MFSKIGMKTTAVAASVAAAGILTATPAFADPQVVPFGQTAELPGVGGSGAIDYTVSDLQPSGHNDGIWYSDVTAKAVNGSPTPEVKDFHARAVNGSTYWVMRGNQVDGLPNQPIASGSQATGRLYFDVRSNTPPDSVLYQNALTDEVVWKS